MQLIPWGCWTYTTYHQSLVLLNDKHMFFQHLGHFIVEKITATSHTLTIQVQKFQLISMFIITSYANTLQININVLDFMLHKIKRTSVKHQLYKTDLHRQNNKPFVILQVALFRAVGFVRTSTNLYVGRWAFFFVHELSYFAPFGSNEPRAFVCSHKNVFILVRWLQTDSTIHFFGASWSILVCKSHRAGSLHWYG